MSNNCNYLKQYSLTIICKIVNVLKLTVEYKFIKLYSNFLLELL